METPFPHDRPVGVFQPTLGPMRFQAAHRRNHFTSLAAKQARRLRRTVRASPLETGTNPPLPMSDPEHDHPEAVSGKPAAAGPPAPASRLSADLAALRLRAAGKPFTVDELTKELKGRGFAMLPLLLALPFCVIPVPGLSTPFGIAVFFIGISIAAGQEPWLPAFARRKTISPARLVRILDGGIWFARTMERFVKPRMRFLQSWPGMMNVIGLGIASGGLLLMLPLPIPFTNTIPAWAVVFLAAGIMQRDGLLVLLGFLLTLASWAFIGLCWVLGVEGFDKLLDLFQR